MDDIKKHEEQVNEASEITKEELEKASGGTPKVQVQDFRISKTVDIASPKLYEA